MLAAREREEGEAPMPLFEVVLDSEGQQQEVRYTDQSLVVGDVLEMQGVLGRWCAHSRPATICALATSAAVRRRRDGLTWKLVKGQRRRVAGWRTRSARWPPPSRRPTLLLFEA